MIRYQRPNTRLYSYVMYLVWKYITVTCIILYLGSALLIQFLIPSMTQSSKKKKWKSQGNIADRRLVSSALPHSSIGEVYISVAKLSFWYFIENLAREPYQSGICEKPKVVFFLHCLTGWLRTVAALGTEDTGRVWCGRRLLLNCLVSKISSIITLWETWSDSGDNNSTVITAAEKWESFE